MSRPPLPDAEHHRRPRRRRSCRSHLHSHHRGGRAPARRPREGCQCRRVLHQVPPRPQAPPPTAVDDATGFLHWIREHTLDNADGWLTEAADFGRVFVTGDSDGSTIAHHLTMHAGLAMPNLTGACGMMCNRAIDCTERLFTMDKPMELTARPQSKCGVDMQERRLLRCRAAETRNRPDPAEQKSGTVSFPRPYPVATWRRVGPICSHGTVVRYRRGSASRICGTDLVPS
ncbi:hypothetical protein OsI_35915 [Oryza sativa Indica Group]|uniref:Alpha/beta hydrolase fold-3 domain-containing protein n=1 Tax=Oryza sativa subsp. indica TaxID=39946 RepID=A2ZDP8_ORYSI|nr:hypothetical protein OsI_35915 [Oryza sativa Indica Group]